MSPQTIEDSRLYSESDNMLSNIANQEIIDIIDKHIPPSERANYLKLKHGHKISNIELSKLKTIILQIIQDHDTSS